MLVARRTLLTSKDILLSSSLGVNYPSRDLMTGFQRYADNFPLSV